MCKAILISLTPPERPRDRPHRHGPGRKAAKKKSPADLVLIAAGFPGLPAPTWPEAFGVDLTPRSNVATASGELPDQCRKNIHSRRHAPRPVIGRLGNTRRKRSRKRSRQKSDGVYKLGIATSSAHKSRESQKGKFTFHSAVFCSYAYGASRP